MKYITLIIGLLVVGCGKQEQTDTNESTPTTTEKPVKELTLREKVIGSYEVKLGEKSVRIDLLETGIVEYYINGKKDDETEGKWKIVNKQIYLTADHMGPHQATVFRINNNSSITHIAIVSTGNGFRLKVPKNRQLTLKKIK